jgi:hypothetical protein
MGRRIRRSKKGGRFTRKDDWTTYIPEHDSAYKRTERNGYPTFHRKRNYNLTQKRRTNEDVYFDELRCNIINNENKSVCKSLGNINKDILRPDGVNYNNYLVDKKNAEELEAMRYENTRALRRDRSYGSSLLSEESRHSLRKSSSKNSQSSRKSSPRNSQSSRKSSPRNSQSSRKSSPRNSQSSRKSSK